MECVACACSYVSDVIVALLHTFSGRLVVFLSIIRQLITTSIPRCTVTLRQGGGRWRPEVYYLHISEWNVLINIQTREHTHTHMTGGSAIATQFRAVFICVERFGKCRNR